MAAIRRRSKQCRPIRKIVAIVAVVGGLGTLRALPANSQDKAPGVLPASVVECKVKSFPNLPGINSFSLKNEKGGMFTALTEAYGKPRIYPHLKCHFHSKDRKVFFCATGDGLWAAKGERVQSSGVGSNGSEEVFDGYSFEVTKYPFGEPESVFSMPFDADKCTAPR